MDLEPNSSESSLDSDHGSEIRSDSLRSCLRAKTVPWSLMRKTVRASLLSERTARMPPDGSKVTTRAMAKSVTEAHVRFGENLPRRHQKRKSGEDLNKIPVKIHVTDELLAQIEHLNITNSNGNGGGGPSKHQDDNKMDEGSPLPTLVLSPEVRDLSTFNAALIASSLTHNFHPQTRALMLWRPPAGSLTSQILSSLTVKTENCDNMNNNGSFEDRNARNSGLLDPAGDVDM